MIEARKLAKHYPVVTGLRSLFSRDWHAHVHAVDGVDFTAPAGQVMGLVGESGCGKSTTGSLLVGLEQPTEGTITLGGADLGALYQRDRRAFYRKVQMVFQDPYGSINPSQDVFTAISRPLVYQGIRDKAEIRSRVISAMERVGLSPPEVYLEKHPHLLSGGQRQRLCIARAIILEPAFLVAEEPISMLDVSIKWDIIRLLRRLVRESGLAMVYITHDLATVPTICDRLAIMYLGRLVEVGETRKLLQAPQHPYTRALLASIPSADPHRRRAPAQITGAVNDPINLPKGCRFLDRCPIGDANCAESDPGLTGPEDHRVACLKAWQPIAAETTA